MKDAILLGDCLQQLKTLPAESVQCIVTSPPYFGLRDYGTAQWVGGSASCDHDTAMKAWAMRDIGATTIVANEHRLNAATASRRCCPSCGATRQDAQIGLEETPEQYVARLVEVFSEARRVLRKDGVLWLNLGDSYSSNAHWSGGGPAALCGNTKRVASGKNGGITPGFASKQLLGMPWRVAFALQADGWILRSDVIWHKPNCMPESVKDRPTKAHEYMFLFSKQERYYYDADAIKEDSIHAGEVRMTSPKSLSLGQAKGRGIKPSGNATKPFVIVTDRRNKRTVWTIATAPYSGAHFATFPPALIEPCILAGTSPQACEHCGAPWQRDVQVMSRPNGPTHHGKLEHADKRYINRSSFYMDYREKQYNGWIPTCRCENNGSASCIVLDPFFGAGTVGLVAKQHGRSYLGIELNAAYIALAEQRITEATKPRAKITRLPKRPQPVEQLALFA